MDYNVQELKNRIIAYLGTCNKEMQIGQICGVVLGGLEYAKHRYELNYLVDRLLRELQFEGLVEDVNKANDFRVSRWKKK